MIRRAESYRHFDTGAWWQAKGHSYIGNAPTFDPLLGRPNTAAVIALGLGTNRGAAILSQGTNNQAYVTIMPAAVAPMYDHFAFNHGALAEFFWVYYNTLGYPHIQIVGQADGSFSLYRGSAAGVAHNNLVFSTLIASSAPSKWRASTWHQVQIALNPLSGTSGSFLMKLDGIELTDLTIAAGNLYAGGAANVTNITRSGVTGGTSYYGDSVQVDDTIEDSAIQQYTGLRGDLAVFEDWHPTDGDQLEWERSSGSGTWSSHVDDNPPDEDTTYLRSATAGLRNCFSFPVVTSALGTILAVKETVCHRKEEATFGAIGTYFRDSNNVDRGGALIACTEDYKFDEDIREKDQRTGLSWTPTSVNATKLGIVDRSDEG